MHRYVRQQPAPASVEELTIVMNEIAREFVTTDADDPRRASLVKHLKISPKFGCPSRSQITELIGQRMDELARQMTTLITSDPRRGKIVKEVESLSEMLNALNG
jgi:hypothetical protein